jgi:hypothetical protein
MVTVSPAAAAATTAEAFCCNALIPTVAMCGKVAHCSRASSTSWSPPTLADIAEPTTRPTDTDVDEFEGLGPHRRGKSCLYVKRVDALDPDRLRSLIARSVELATA